MGLKSSTVAVAVLLTLSACVDSRSHARNDFITQLITEGGLNRPQATCVVDKFFETRSTDELKRFFARRDLTDAERADFAAIAKACTP
jgi:predicted transcriptional regulator